MEISSLRRVGAIERFAVAWGGPMADWKPSRNGGQEDSGRPARPIPIISQLGRGIIGRTEPISRISMFYPPPAFIWVRLPN